MYIIIQIFATIKKWEYIAANKHMNANINTQLLPQITVYFPSFFINIGSKDIHFLNSTKRVFCLFVSKKIKNH